MNRLSYILAACFGLCLFVFSTPATSQVAFDQELSFAHLTPRIDGLSLEMRAPIGKVQVDLSLRYNEKGMIVCAGDCEVDGIPVEVKGRIRAVDGLATYRLKAKGQGPSGPVSVSITGGVSANVAACDYRGPKGRAFEANCPVILLAAASPGAVVRFTPEVDCKGKIVGRGYIDTEFNNDQPGFGTLRGKFKARKGTLKLKITEGRQKFKFKGRREEGGYFGKARIIVRPERRTLFVMLDFFGLPPECPDAEDLEPENRAPLADAGPDQTVNLNDTVTLDGSASSDVDGDVLTHQWTLVSRPAGSQAVLSDPNAVRPTFVVDQVGVYEVDLVVNDGELDSASSTVRISTENSEPIARSGADRSVLVNDIVQLDGTASSDPDGDALTYAWSFVSVPAGSQALFSDATAARPTFDVDLAGAYEVELVVNDGQTDSVADSIVVNTQNSPPEADAGADQTVHVNDTVTLDASGSSDVDGDTLGVTWSFTTIPAGSQAALSDPSSCMPTFVADLPGSYIAQLVVNDGEYDSQPDTVVISTDNSRPVAEAGADQAAAVGDRVTLDATGSFDVDGDVLGASWSFLSRPSGSQALLSDPGAMRPTFIVDLPGDYIVQLVVNDGSLGSQPDSVTVSTTNTPPLADAGANQSVFVGDTVQLDGSRSTDLDGDPLSYSWSLLQRPATSLATIANGQSAMPTFAVDLAGVYVAQLVVSDGKVSSQPATVTITTRNSAPVADAGADQSAFIGDLVQLDGATSFDVDGDPLSYRWSFSSVPTGSQARLSGSTGVGPSFTVDAPGDYVVQLIVNDGTVDSPPASVTVSHLNSAPVADPGADLGVEVGGSVNLDGSGSSDVDGDALDYTWSFTSRPTGSSATLSDPNAEQPSFDADLAGDYIVQLVVNDGQLNSSPETVLVRSTSSISITPGLLELFTGEFGTLTVTTSTPAPQGGQAIALVSSDATIASVPATITIPAGAISNTVRVDTDLQGGTVTITASAAGFSNDQATVEVTPASITLSMENSLVGVDRTIQGTVTLVPPAPAGGVTVTLSSSDTNIATITPATLTIPAGQSRGTLIVKGVAEGTASFTASAGAIGQDDDQVQVTDAVISLGQDLILAPGQKASLPVSIAIPPLGAGLTINFSSSDPTIATVTSSVFIPQGALVPAVNPQVTGIRVGQVEITATAAGFASDTRDATVTLTLSLSPDPFSVVENTTKDMTLNISAPAPQGGLRVNLSTADDTVATVPSSVLVAAGSTSVKVPVSGLKIASTTVRATSQGLQDETATINVTEAPAITLADTTVGKHSHMSATCRLAAPAPAGGVEVTIVSADASRVIVSGSATGAGVASLKTTVAAGSSIFTLYVQALQESGVIELTTSAPGYKSEKTNVTLAPSGFMIWSPTQIDTTVFATNTNVQVAAVRLNPATLAYARNQGLRGGFSVNVALSIQDTTIGHLVEPTAEFVSNLSFKSVGFDPEAAGTSEIRLGTPAGFRTPTARLVVPVTVTAPDITIADVTVGRDLQHAVQVRLESAPPTPLTVTLTSADASKATLSTTATSAGSGSVTFTNVTSTLVGTVHVQGRGLGQTAITVTAPGYNDGTSTVTVDPSGFMVWSPTQINTTVFAVNSTVQVASVRLNPSTLAYARNQVLRGGLTISVPLTVQDTSVGTLLDAAAVLGANEGFKAVGFSPLDTGATEIRLATPGAFSTPTSQQVIPVTVTAPDITMADVTVGRDLQHAVVIRLESAPPAATTVTVTSSNDNVSLSTDPTRAGARSASFSNVTSTIVGTIHVQGRQLGTSTITVEATGYNNGVSTATVNPSGFMIWSPNAINTTTFAANSTVQVASVRLDPTTLRGLRQQPLRGGLNGVAISISSSATNIGDLTDSSVVFNANDNFVSTSFDPEASGTTMITLGTPSAFTTPSASTEILATVNAPDIRVSDVTVGRDLQWPLTIRLESAPPNPLDVTVTSSSGAVVTVSATATDEGASSLTFQNVTSTIVGTVYVQGRNVGGATLTIKAPGYNDGISQVTVDPSAFVIWSPASITTTASANNLNVQIAPVRLHPTTLNVARIQTLRGGLSVDVPVTSSAASIGVITVNPVTIVSNLQVTSTGFDPVGVGTTTVSVGVPAGFHTPSNQKEITATVNP